MLSTAANSTVSGGPGAALLRGAIVQAEVVYALVLRETRTRFGNHRLGYLWALLEPIIVILTFYGLFEIAKRSTPPGMDVFTFITTGFLPYQLFSSTTARVAESINGNRALLYYPPVKPVDLVIARSLLETVTHMAVFLVLMGLHGLYCQELIVDEPLKVLLGLVFAALLGTGVGLVFCCLALVSNAADRARGPLLRPLFWISGIFFTGASVPDAFRNIATKNPVFHVIELVRDGWFTTYDSDHVHSVYVLCWIGALAVLGLALERVVRKRIETS